jgi:TfoX/Sxy family transcriptional regulator of competence genes
MGWKKNSDELVKLIDDTMVPFSCERKFMFGGPTFLVNGNMFAGVCQDSPFLKLAGPDREALQAAHKEAAPFEPMPGRPMREYVVLPASLYSDPATLHDWIRRSIDYASSLPAKKPKSKKRG